MRTPTRGRRAGLALVTSALALALLPPAAVASGAPPGPEPIGTGTPGRAAPAPYRHRHPGHRGPGHRVHRFRRPDRGDRRSRSRHLAGVPHRDLARRRHLRLSGHRRRRSGVGAAGPGPVQRHAPGRRRLRRRRGPTADGSLKPEITAPGVAVVAARAAGTSLGRPVDGSYTALNGTSMATPHVAGAAALLIQQHPEWKPDRLKDALVSTAETAPDHSVHEQGAGRLAVDRAPAAAVLATGTADFASVAAGQGPLTRTVTYTNTGAEDVTLDLDLVRDRGEAVPDGAVSLSASRVVVPAGGAAPVTVTVDPTAGGLGRYEGFLTATGDGAALTTAVNYVKAPPRRTVTFRLTGRDGEAAGQVDLQSSTWSPTR
ncbi:S8 family serine peptidase [Streptomyces sp. NPDC035033]|uniref:S8 family serine peptidase n=1 Tax=Streptomyces sp. NPDC035033 TaxID=3155368 RepID=UPI0033E2BAE1